MSQQIRTRTNRNSICYMQTLGVNEQREEQLHHLLSGFLPSTQAEARHHLQEEGVAASPHVAVLL